MPLILRRIRQSGPMPLSEYMALCLSHPEHGYYMTRDPLGRGGDFTTAPEISQMFGELVGLWLAEVWRRQGSARGFLLAELGPGRGTLMADILRAAALVPGFVAAARVMLVETSPALRARQAGVLAGVTPRWLGSVADLPDDRPLFVIANEFFDALPIRQFVRHGPAWRETLVGAEGGQLTLGLGPALRRPDLDKAHPSAAEGQIAETCAAGQAIARALGARIRARGGAALIIDYGAWTGTGASFQAVRFHAFADPLAQPGEADLTAHVDFSALALASNLRPAFATQGAFLNALGLQARAETLIRQAKDPARVLADARRLTDPAAMGELFKVLALTPGDAPEPPGFS